MTTTDHKHNLKPIQGVLSDLREQGYSTDFRFAKNKLIPFQYPTRSYSSSQITTIDTYRFEGDTDPGDSSIMYVIETDDGLKGTIINSYNAEADINLDQFIEETKQAS